MVKWAGCGQEGRVDSITHVRMCSVFVCVCVSWTCPLSSAYWTLIGPVTRMHMVIRLCDRLSTSDDDAL